MAKVADPLRERVKAMCAASGLSGERLYAIADQIDAEHARRMSQSRREVRRDFARYMRSCIADYEKGIARRNRNHTHAKVSYVKIRGVESVVAHCTNCGRVISDLASYCCWCGAKVTAREY
jgi:hypothetical protein